MSRAQTGWRAVACSVALTLVATVAACGESESGDDAGDAEVEQRVETVYRQMVKAVYDGDAKRGCALISDVARRRIVKDDRSVRTCEEAFATRVDPDALSENRPSVVAVNVDGDRAVAVVKTRNSDRYRVPLVREGSDWKVNTGF